MKSFIFSDFIQWKACICHCQQIPLKCYMLGPLNRNIDAIEVEPWCHCFWWNLLLRMFGTQLFQEVCVCVGECSQHHNTSCSFRWKHCLWKGPGRTGQMWLLIHVEHTHRSQRVIEEEDMGDSGAHDEPTCRELDGNDRRLQGDLCVWLQPTPRSCCYAPAHVPSRCQHEEDHSLGSATCERTSVNATCVCRGCAGADARPPLSCYTHGKKKNLN